MPSYATPPDVLVAENVSKSFGDTHVLKDFSLRLKEGESFVLLGQSGSGKSVFLKTVLGLISPESGTLTVNGCSVAKESHKQRRDRMAETGTVFQGSALFDSLSVWQNVAFALVHPPRCQPVTKARTIALEKLVQVGLNKEVADVFPSALSGGMKRRVALARAIALNPRFLLLDEPTAGLDPVFSRLIADLINICRKTLKATTLTITHDLHLATTISDRMGMLSGGKLVWDGTKEDVRITTNSLVKKFFGV